MPRFTGQNKKKIDPRYFINETVEELPRLGDEVELNDGRRGEIIDVMGQSYEVAINDAEGGYGMFDGSVTVSIHDIKSVGPNYPGHGDLPGRVNEAFPNVDYDNQSFGEKLAPGAAKSDVLLAQTLSQFERKLPPGISLDMTFYESVMYRMLREEGVQRALDYITSRMNNSGRGDTTGYAEVMGQLEKDLEFIKRTSDLEVRDLGGRVGPNFQPSKETPFKDQRSLYKK